MLTEAERLRVRITQLEGRARCMQKALEHVVLSLGGMTDIAAISEAYYAAVQQVGTYREVCRRKVDGRRSPQDHDDSEEPDMQLPAPPVSDIQRGVS
jgi:hypothetical protein